MQALSRFVTGPDVISSIVGWTLKKVSGSDKSLGFAPRFLVLAGEQDVLCTPSILKDAADRYSVAFNHCIRTDKLDGLSQSDIRPGSGGEWDGVRFRVAKALGHHLQNHVEWERGAEEIFNWVEQL